MDRVILTSLFINHSERDSAKQHSPETVDLAFAWLPGLGTGDIEDLSNAFSSKPNQIKITLGQFLDGVIEDGHFSDSSPIRHPSPIPSFYNPLILDEPESAGESMASA